MSHTITVRLSEELAAWLAESARRTGLPAGRIIRQQLEKAKAETGNQPFLKHAGQLAGPGGPLLAEGIHTPMKGIADTGFIVAFGNRNDRHHAWAVEVARQITEPLLTCEAVLAEAAFHLRSSSYVLTLVEDGMLRLAFDCARNVPQLRELARRFEDRQPDLADLCLIRMSELFPRHVVITVDEDDFRVYRRHKREAIPLLSPPRAKS